MVLEYRGNSRITPSHNGLTVSLAPNLRRDRVRFRGTLRDPVRFREAICALHDLVISDRRYRPKDPRAYREYLAEQQRQGQAVYESAYRRATQELIGHELDPASLQLEADYSRLCQLYWKARSRYSRHLQRHDPELWRLLVPCDPVITVAEDVIFFECFSADESSYGCLTMDRGAFTADGDVAPGTTNVDYSSDLYEHFQQLRSYQHTTFEIDPLGFEVASSEGDGIRQEKIDLPARWLRGFMQVQAAMNFPMRRVPLSRGSLYNLLGWLRRHRARRSPRAVRFELRPGQPVQIVLEPWEQRIVQTDLPYPGAREETIRVWGRDRLRVLGRLLPLMEEGEVFLLGSGLPSFWVIRMGELRMTLGLSGWTTNDWAGDAALDQLAPPAWPSRDLVAAIATTFAASPARTFEQICRQTAAPPFAVAAGLNQLARFGQVIHDLPAAVYRWRQVMPVELSLSQVAPEDPETVAACEIIASGQVTVLEESHPEAAHRSLKGKAGGRTVSGVLDEDGRLLRGKCTCSHHHQNGLRKGPCRHLQALRACAAPGKCYKDPEEWYRSLWGC